MEKTEEQATEESRKGLESGACKNWTPDDFDTLIKALASDHARPDETEAQSYTRMIMEHPAGRLLFKGYRAASLGGAFAAETFGGETREDRIAKQADLDPKIKLACTAWQSTCNAQGRG